MTYLFAAGLAAFILGLSKGGMPVVSILAVPLLALAVDPLVAAGLLLPIYLVADLYAVYLFRKAFSPRNLKILIPSAFMGVLLGYFAVSAIPGDAIKLLLVFIGFSYLANAWRGRLAKTQAMPRRADVPRGIVWGALAGLTSYISHAGGAPYQAYVLPQRLDKFVYLGTTTIFFMTVNLMKLPAFILAGQVTWPSVYHTVWLAPLALAGAWSGAQISKWLPERIFFLIVEIALALVCLKLLYEVLAQ